MILIYKSKLYLKKHKKYIIHILLFILFVFITEIPVADLIRHVTGEIRARIRIESYQIEIPTVQMGMG